MSDDTTKPETKHRNDPYGSFEGQPESAGSPLIPAATVVLLRDGTQGIEVLMLRKTSKISFGGMWVFPGGKIDAEDYPGKDPDSGATEAAARNAAVRETAEEAGLALSVDDFVQFSHWTPPPSTPKRFATWFFAAPARGAEDIVRVDGQEIDDYQWVNPTTALERHALQEIDLVPPTWVSLYHLSQFDKTAAAISRLQREPVRSYFTRLAKRSDGVRVAMWHGDAGYDDYNADADVSQNSHRLVMAPGGFEYLHGAVDY